MVNTVAILGAGNGGQAMAADLKLRGFRVHLWESEEQKKSIEAIVRSGNRLRVNLLGNEHTVQLDKVGTELGSLIDGVQVICIAVPSFAADVITEKLAPVIRDEQVILYSPGGTGNALVGAQILRLYGKTNAIAEMSTLPYAARRSEDGGVNILLQIKKLFTGVFPANERERVIELIRPLYPDAIEPVATVLESSLNNGNPVTHPIPTLLNTSRVALAIPYLFYQEIVPEMAGMNEILDEERMKICDLFGYRRINACERLYLTGYSPKEECLYKSYKNSEPFSTIKAPAGLSDRYFLEDVGYGLFVYQQMGRQWGVATPLASAVVTMVQGLLGADFSAERGRTLKEMGLEGLSVEQTKEYLQTGKK